VAFPANPADLEVCLAYGANLASDLTTLTYSSNLSTTLVLPQLLITRGRIGGAVQTQPTSIEFGLKNPGGVFSPRNVTGPHYGQLRRNTPVRVRLDPGTGMVTRAIAYMPDWPVRWTGPDIGDYIPMQASGALRRLGVGSDPKSAMRRRLLASSEPVPNAYWPCEDGPDATSVSSGLPGGSPMTGFSGGTPVFGPGFGGSSGSLDFNAMPDDGGVVATASLASASGFQVEYMAQSDAAATIFTVVQIDCGTFEAVFGMSAAAADGLPHHFAIQCVQNGANVDVTSYRDGIAGATTPLVGVLNRSLAISSRNPAPDDSLLVAHLVVYDFASMGAPTTRAPAAVAYVGELAADRVTRLCAEEGIAVDVTSGISEPMGPQPVATIIDLLRECETSDEATLIERRTGKLGFDPRSSREDTAVTMAVNYVGQVAVLLPDDDDRDLLNYVTVTRIGGTSATYERTDGPLGTNKATGVDRYPDSLDRSLAADAQALQHASYLVAKGTVDEPRFTIGLNLRAHPELVTQWLACDIGSRIQVTNPPAIQTGPGPLDLIIEGYEELLDAVQWEVTLYCVPCRPYKVFQLGDDGLVLPGTAGNYASTPDTSVLDIVGDIDLRADVVMTDWTPANNSTLVSKRGAAGQRSYLFQVQTTGVLSLTWSTDGTAQITDTSTVAPTVTDGARLAVRVTLDVNNGAAGHTTTFYTAPTITGTWTQLGSTVITAGTTSIFNSTAPVEVGAFNGGASDLLAGTMNVVEVRDGLAGTVVANPDFTAQPSGRTSFADAAGRTWTVNGTARIVGGEYMGRLDWSSCVLAASLNTTATSTTTTTTPLMTTDPGDFPLNVMCGGERITITACTGSSNPQTLTLIRSVNGVVKSHLSGDAVTIDAAMALAL
jgi:hypothetical protein